LGALLSDQVGIAAAGTEPREFLAPTGIPLSPVRPIEASPRYSNAVQTKSPMK
jgi:hypothetical protein